jgi:hypothetical protein
MLYMLELVNIYSVREIYNSILKYGFISIRICKGHKNTRNVFREYIPFDWITFSQSCSKCRRFVQFGFVLQEKMKWIIYNNLGVLHIQIN